MAPILSGGPRRSVFLLSRHAGGPGAAGRARIRANNRVSPADAIHLASAAQSGVNLFLTNDRVLPKLVISGIDFIAGLDVNLF
jgi:hypothetical protein